MKFTYCPDCGAKLTPRDLGDERGVPWCPACNRPWFPLFPSAVIVLVYNDRGEVLLLRQNYISTEFRNLVSGYVVPGETAEQCAVREVKEETGLDIDRLQLVMTHWYQRKDMMMIGFFAHTSQVELRLSSEVDGAEWVRREEVLRYLSSRPGATSRLLAEKFLSENREKEGKICKSHFK